MNDKPAYPIPALAGKSLPSAGDVCGLTRRELFAAMAMQGFAADPSNNEDWSSYVASGGMAAAAVGWADSLIAELDK